MFSSSNCHQGTRNMHALDCGGKVLEYLGKETCNFLPHDVAELKPQTRSRTNKALARIINVGAQNGALQYIYITTIIVIPRGQPLVKYMYVHVLFI